MDHLGWPQAAVLMFGLGAFFALIITILSSADGRRAVSYDCAGVDPDDWKLVYETRTAGQPAPP